jgi:hypothetical protein
MKYRISLIEREHAQGWHSEVWNGKNQRVFQSYDGTWRKTSVQIEAMNFIQRQPDYDPDGVRVVEKLWTSSN